MTSTNDGKDVKSYQTSGPKGKSYYIELYKTLEARLSESGEANERTRHLCEAWRRVHSLCQHSAPSTHLHLLSWLQRHTARTVLQTGWQSPKRKEDRKRLEDAINEFVGQCAEAQESRCGENPPWESQLVARGEWFKRILDQPWDHPVLTLLLNPNGTPPTDDELLQWLREERGVTFVMRLHTLVSEKCEDLACSLAAAVMDRVRASAHTSDRDDDEHDKQDGQSSSTFGDKLREEAGFTIDVWEMLIDIEFVLQHKRDSQRCIALAKKTPLRGAYQLIERLQSRLETSPREKRLWKNAKEVAILIAQVVIARCMVIPSCSGAARSALYCCARSLAHRAPARLLAAGAALAAPAPTARHLHTFAAAVRAHLPPTNEQKMKPFVCELYVRAITAGMNELEKLKLKTEKEAESRARAAAQTLAAWVVQLGGVLAGGALAGARVLAECYLTAFSLHPSPHMYDCLAALTPPAPVPKDINEPKEEATKSDFGSWASDSRSQTNFVKTSETLNMKHTQNQANVLSTAILNEGEAIGLGQELCQDIAVVLSGPRIKTLSWDMDREELLEKCRSYMERTRGGTLALTTELKYLNLDPANFLHLPEERDEDEDNIYYGIEKGYEHLVQFEEPEQWDDRNDPSKTDTATSCQDDDEIILGRKKKNKDILMSSDEDSDPLSKVAESKRHQKKKERPHSKERSRQNKDKKHKKKLEDAVDPLQPDDQKVEKPKEKKERKKKEKVLKVQGDKPLSDLVGLKVAKGKKKKSIKDAAQSFDYFSEGKLSQQSLNSDSNGADDRVLVDGTFSMDESQSSNGSNKSLKKNNQFNYVNGKVINAPVFVPPQSAKQLSSNVTYKPWLPNTSQRQGLNNKNIPPKYKAFPDDVRASISKLLEFRRQKGKGLEFNKQPKQNAHMIHRKPTNAIVPSPEVQIQTNISPKAVAIPEIPKSYINKQQSEKLAELKRGVDMILSQRKQTIETEPLHPAHKPVIQYARKPKPKPPVTDPMFLNSRVQHTNTNALKMSDLINVSTDRLTLEKMIRENSSNAMYGIPKQPHTQNLQKHLDTPQDNPSKGLTSGQNDYLQFLKEYQAIRNNTLDTDCALDMSTKTPVKDTKKDIKPTSRVIPVVPTINNKPEPKLQQSAKPSLQQKKPDASLNTFSRLSYMHKNKQSEMKSKNATELPVFSFSTYQEVSSELDEIIRKHKLAQMKVIQSKNSDKFSRIIEPAASSTKSNIEHGKKLYQIPGHQARDHPVLSNLLEHNKTTTAPSLYQNETLHKNTPVQQKLNPTPQSALTSSDQNEITNLLRQQNKLNSAFYQTTRIYSTTPSSGAEKNTSQSPVYNVISCPKQQVIVNPTQTPTPVKNCQSRDTKVINIISNSVIKPADKVNSETPLGTKSTTQILVAKKNIKGQQDKAKKYDISKIQTKKPSTASDAKKQEDWESVMNAILKHKTPFRGPNALDVALNKSSFEKAFEDSIKEPSVLRQPTPNNNSQLERAKHPKVIPLKSTNTHYTYNEIETMKLQATMQSRGIEIKKCSDSITNQKPIKVNSSEMSKKLPQEVQRKQFTYAGLKEDDPFISGIPNSDYDLLEELMDDDLRKEIGELSSDEESFNTAAQSFLKSPKNEEKKVSVEFNTPTITETPPTKSTGGGCLNAHIANVEQNVIKSDSRKPQGVITANISIKTQETATKTCQSVPADISTVPGYSNINTVTNPQIDPNIYITAAVPQQTPIQNVVLIGSDLVYGGYSTVQTPINNVSNIDSKTYLAVNNVPNMTLYQTSGYSTPIVSPLLMGNAITVPVPVPVNDVSCASVSLPPPLINNVPEPVNHDLDSPQVISHNTNVSAGDVNVSNNAAVESQIQSEVITANEKTQDVSCVKINERKVLSEVQERLIGIENTDKTTTEHEKTIIKDACDNKERLKKKRMAIINREIYHRCGSTPIPLSYSPLPPSKIHLNGQDLLKVIPDNLITLNTHAQSNRSEDINECNNQEIAILNTEIIKNRLSHDIGDIASPVTPDNNESCKENKSSTKLQCPRILLRSSKRMKSKTDQGTVTSIKSRNKKSKAKLKPETPCVEKVLNVSSQRKKGCKNTILPKRSSKRLRNKSIKDKDIEITKFNLKSQEQSLDQSNLITEHNEKVVPSIINNNFKLQDVEEEIPGSIIVTSNISDFNHKPSDSDHSDHGVSDELPVTTEKSDIMFNKERFSPKHNEHSKESTENHDNVLTEYTNLELSPHANDSKTEKPQQELKHETNHIIDNAIDMAKESTAQSEPQLITSKESNTLSNDTVINIVRPAIDVEKKTKTNDTLEKSTDNACVLSNFNINSDNDTGADEFSENDNIDLDMMVTCEETNINHKTHVQTDVICGKTIAECVEYKKANHSKAQQITPESKVCEINKNEPPLTETLKSKALDANDITKISNSKTTNTQPTESNENVTANNSSTELISLPPSDMDDDIQIIDSNLPFPSVKCDTIATEIKESPNQNKITHQLIHQNNNTQDTIAPSNRNSGLDDISDLSEISQSYKDSIIIEPLPNLQSGDRTKKCVRVKLPNGRTFKATVYGEMHVNFDTLFTNPAIKSTLLNSLHSKKRYTMNIKQVTKIAKSDPSKILSTKLSEIKPTDPVETIDLLSDDESETRSETLDVASQFFETEYGKFKISSIDQDILAKHQIKFKQQAVVALYDIRTKVGDYINSRPSYNGQLEKLDVDIQCYEKLDKKTNGNSPAIAHKLISGLINDIDDIMVKKISSNLKNVPDIVEIDDSSNEGAVDLSYENNETKNKTNELIDALLQDFGISQNGRCTSIPTSHKKQIPNKPVIEEIITIVDDLPNEPLKICSTSDTHPSNLCLDKTSKNNNNNIDKKCYVKLIRCDDLLKMRCGRDVNNTTSELTENQEEKNSLELSLEPLETFESSDITENNSDRNSNHDVTILESFNFLSDIDTNVVESESERSSSPVIELFDVIASLECTHTRQRESKVYESNSLSCSADWFTTKHTLNATCLTSMHQITSQHNQGNEEDKHIEISVETAISKKNKVPRLISLVLKLLQDTEVLCKIESMRDILSQSEKIRLLKRKSTSLDSNNMPKVLKLDPEIIEPKSQEILSNVTLDSSTTDKNTENSIVEDANSISNLEINNEQSCEEKSRDSSIKTYDNILAKCEDNHNMNEHHYSSEVEDKKVVKVSNLLPCNNQDISPTKSSETLSEKIEIADTSNEISIPCSSPVNEICHLILENNMKIISSMTEILQTVPDEKENGDETKVNQNRSGDSITDACHENTIKDTKDISVAEYEVSGPLLESVGIDVSIGNTLESNEVDNDVLNLIEEKINKDVSVQSELMESVLSQSNLQDTLKIYSEPTKIHLRVESDALNITEEDDTKGLRPTELKETDLSNLNVKDTTATDSIEIHDPVASMEIGLPDKSECINVIENFVNVNENTDSVKIDVKDTLIPKESHDESGLTEIYIHVKCNGSDKDDVNNHTSKFTESALSVKVDNIKEHTMNVIDTPRSSNLAEICSADKVVLNLTEHSKENENSGDSSVLMANNDVENEDTNVVNEGIDLDTKLLHESENHNFDKKYIEPFQLKKSNLCIKTNVNEIKDESDDKIEFLQSGQVVETNLIEKMKLKPIMKDLMDIKEPNQISTLTQTHLLDVQDIETNIASVLINSSYTNTGSGTVDKDDQVCDTLRQNARQDKCAAIMDHEYTSHTINCQKENIKQYHEYPVHYTSHSGIFLSNEEEVDEIIQEVIDTDDDNILDDVSLEIDKVNDDLNYRVVNEQFTSTLNNDFSLGNIESNDPDEDTVAIWNVSARNIDNEEEISFSSSDTSSESIISKYLSLISADESNLIHSVKEIQYEDPEAGTCYIFPIIGKSDTDVDVKEKVRAMVNTIIHEMGVNTDVAKSDKELETDSCKYLKLTLPKRTYSKISQTNEIKTSKRKINMSDIQFLEKKKKYGFLRKSKYKYDKNIDYPKFSITSVSDTSYIKENKSMFDYCNSINFSYSIPFHKEYIDVQKILESWPIRGNGAITEGPMESEQMLFTDMEGNLQTITNPIKLTFAEEIKSEFNENNYKSTKTEETNFCMGFGEGSGRVKKNQRDGEYTFSAATLSDVKQIQPLLPSKEKQNLFGQSIGSEYQNYKLKIKSFYDHLNLKEKVKSFFEKSKAELTCEYNLYNKKEKDDYVNKNAFANWPFCLASPEYIHPAPVEITVNVVQVGQLPVSAAAQNPVSCDPRVTHVSNVSPSECSPENNSSDELQTSIKTEYTELTTADITLPLMQEYAQHHHPLPNEMQDSTNIQSSDDNIPMATEIKSVVKIELMEETSQEQMEENMRFETQRLQQLSESSANNGIQYHYDNLTNNVVHETEVNLQHVTSSAKEPNAVDTFTKNKQTNDAEKTDQIAHAMNAAGITATQDALKTTNGEALVNIISQNTQSGVVSSQNTNYSKSTPITTMALQQALAQILPPPLNQTSENNQPTSTNPQILHIVQGNNTPSVINKPNGTQLVHIVQNKNATATNGTPTSQSNTFGGLSLVDGAAIQQNGNLLHIVNTGNQKSNNNAGQLLKRVNLLTNIANVQGANDKLVHVLCKSADGKSIQLPPQRSMVLRLQPLDPPGLQTPAKQNECQDTNPPSNAPHTVDSVNGKEQNSQEIKSRSLYEENYAKFVQNGEPKSGQEKSTCLPKFNQVFGKQVYQDKQNEIENNNMPENSDCTPEDNIQLDQITDIGSPPMLIRKPQNTPPAQPNLVQQIKQTIGPMNIPMHGGVIYTRQIPVNIGNGQTINLITVPSTEMIDDTTQKLQTDGKFGNQEGDPPIIKIVPTNQPSTTSNGGSEDNNGQIGSTNEPKPQNSQPQPVLTQMRIKLPMLSKAPQMVGGARVVRPFFQIQRNVIGGTNQQVYQQLLLTAAPQLGQTIRLPAQTQKPKAPSETQSSPESQMSSSTLEQLREFDMVLEQVKERSTVQPGSSTSNNNFSKLNTSADTTDAASPSTSTLKQDPATPVLYSVGSTQPINIANFVNRKSTITSTPSSTSSFVRSPDSTGITESPSSSTHVHLPHTATTSEACASSSCASEAAVASTSVPPKPKKKSKPKSSSSSSNPFKINSTPPKPSSQKPLEDEQTTQRILYILAEYKEQVENSPDKDKPAPRRRNNPAAPSAGTSKRKKSSSGSRKRDSSPIGEDSCRTMGSEDSSCGTSLGECNECLESHSPEESPRKVVRKLTFEQETSNATQPRTTTIPQRNVIVADGQAFAVRNTTGKPATTVLMPANYLLPVSMVKGGQQIAIVTNRGPKLLVGAGEGGTGGTLLFQRLIGPAGLKPVLTRPGVRHIRLPTAALHNLQTFNIATPTPTVTPPDSTASPAPASAPAPAPPDLIDTRAMSSPWPDRASEGEPKPDKGNSSPEGSEPWNLPSSSIADDYGYEEIVRTDNMDRTVLVVQRKDGRHHRLTHVSAAALRHKYAIIEHELRLQKSLSEECEDLGVDSPSASELFPEAELLFAPSPAHEQTIDQCHTPPSFSQGIPQPDLDDQIASDRLLTQRHDDLDINLDDVGEIVTVGEDGMTTIQLDHEEFARSHPNTTFHSEPEDGEIPPFSIAQGLKGRPITFSRGVPGTVVMAPQTTVISQATVEATGTQNTVKFTDIDNIINAMPSPHPQMPSVLVKDDGLHKFDSILNDSREVHLPNPSSIVHSTGNGTQVIRRVACEPTRERYSIDDDILRRDDKLSANRRGSNGEGPERQPEQFWEASRPERRRFDLDADKCCKYEDSGNHTRLDSVIKAARSERRRSDSPLGDAQPPLRTYPARRPHSSSHSSHASHASDERNSRARERCHDEGRRRASNRGVVKRGCHCCNGSTAPPKPKKSKKRPGDYHTHN